MTPKHPDNGPRPVACRCPICSPRPPIRIMDPRSGPILGWVEPLPDTPEAAQARPGGRGCCLPAIRCTPEERARWQGYARARGKSLSELVRDLLDGLG
jgi:hypothetical protein